MFPEINKLLLFPDLTTSPSLTATSECTCNEFIWEEGRLFLENEFDFSKLEYQMETPFEGLLTEFAVLDIGAPIISSRIKQLFDKFQINAQYFPVQIIDKTGSLVKNEYFATNFIEIKDCINFNTSIIEVEIENNEIVDIIEVDTIKLKNQSFGSIYRMHMFERVIVVEGDLAIKLQDENFSGMKLIQPEKWDGISNKK